MEALKKEASIDITAKKLFGKNGPWPCAGLRTRLLKRTVGMAAGANCKGYGSYTNEP
jgi:hypothetical protein